MHMAILPTQERFVPKNQTFVTRLTDQINQIVRSIRHRRTLDAAVLRVVLVVCALATVYRGLSVSFSGSNTSLLNNYNVDFYDLSHQTTSTWDASKHDERILICMPLRNSENVMDLAFSHFRNLTYPHHLIDIAFLISDSTDDTAKYTEKLAKELEAGPKDERFNSIEIFHKDFNAVVGQGFSDRHGVAVQGVRRKLMGRARNWLLAAALRPEHSWVYWRDADIETAPQTILEDLMSFEKDVTVPNVWRPLPKFLGGAQAYDLNSWVESPAALDLARTLDEDDVIVEGYAEYPTWRVHLGYLRDETGKGNIREVMDLDGVGGVSIMSKAKVFRTGTNFPGFAFENHAETEGFGKMARRMGYSIGGLPQYTIWHLYEPSDDDIKQMAELKAKGEPYD